MLMPTKFLHRLVVEWTLVLVFVSRLYLLLNPGEECQRLLIRDLSRRIIQVKIFRMLTDFKSPSSSGHLYFVFVFVTREEWTEAPDVTLKLTCLLMFLHLARLHRTWGKYRMWVEQKSFPRRELQIRWNEIRRRWNKSIWQIEAMDAWPRRSLAGGTSAPWLSAI